MSRIGKVPVDVPSGVEVTLEQNTISVKGPKGNLSKTFFAPCFDYRGGGADSSQAGRRQPGCPGAVRNHPFNHSQYGSRSDGALQ